jgi:hypothetical protein
MTLKTSTTARGFDWIEFTDLYGKECSLQKSSLATDDAIWFGVDSADPKILATEAVANGVVTSETCGWVPYPIPEAVSLATRMHLNREQVAALLPILERFVDTGEITEQEARP